MCDVISEKEILKHLKNSHVPIYVFDEIDSTNRFAKELDLDFALVVSDSQYSGRGRLGRKFYSPKGTGIYMTLRVKVSDLYNLVPFITTISATGVHKAIKTICHKDLCIKWVNDIYANGKKVSGILCEIADDSHAVIGIGINFLSSPMPEELSCIAASLFEHDAPITRCELIAKVTDNILTLLSHLPDTSFMEYYKANSIVLGKDVLCIQGNSTFEAHVLDIDPKGGLVVKTKDKVVTLSSGEITVRFKSQNPMGQT
ncbi:MAG: biotin--[acetyl-CoA-carboxylase] ligase [Clostridia bacterium]